MKPSRILSLCLLIAFLLPIFPLRTDAAANTPVHYLAVGIDDAASNTDVIAVISYDPHGNRVTVLQIPRDTYYCFGGVQNKLNQLYPHLLAGRDTRTAKEMAMKGLASAVTALLGVRINAYVAVSISDFSEAIDRLGGVPMHLPIDVGYFDESTGEEVVLKAGEHLLSGKAATAFVRHRASYPTGDLGRIDAQKLFLSAFFARLASRLSLRTMTSVFGGIRTSLITNLTLPEAIKCGTRFVKGYTSTEIRYLTLPGAPALHDGISYYGISQPSVEEAIEKYLLFGSGQAQIDPSCTALHTNSPSLSEIYRKRIDYRVYTDTELRS